MKTKYTDVILYVIISFATTIILYLLQSHELKSNTFYEEYFQLGGESTDPYHEMFSKDSLLLNGYQKDSADTGFDKFLSAYRDSISRVQARKGKRYRSDLIIRYYEKPLDSGKVLSLDSLGFYIHIRPSKKKYQNSMSNIIYYGDSASEEDIKAVAFFLRSRGLPIVRISESKFHDDYKVKSIELATDTTITDQKPLTSKEIWEFVK